MSQCVFESLLEIDKWNLLAIRSTNSGELTMARCLNVESHEKRHLLSARPLLAHPTRPIGGSVRGRLVSWSR